MASRPTLELLRLAAPMVGVTVSRMLVNFIDVFMVSMLGTAAQAAIAPSTTLLFAISCLGMGLAQSVQTFVAQAEGRGEPSRAGTYVWHAIYVGILMGIVTIPVALTVPQWLGALSRAAGHSPEVQAMEVGFLSTALWFVGPATICSGLESFFNGVQRPRVGLVAILASLVTVALANYALIFGHWGFPALGIRGAGIATVLAWTVRMAVLLVPLGWSTIDARYGTRTSWRPDRDRLLEIARLGWPISVQWLVDIGAWVVFLEILIPPFGAVQMAAATIAIQYMHLSFMPALGIGMALTTQVGNAVGANDPELARVRVRVALRVVVAYMGSMAVLFVVAGHGLAMLWLQYEPDLAQRSAVADATATVLLCCAAFQMFDALCITYSFALRGAGDTRMPAVLFAACCWGIFIGGGLFVGRVFPQWGAMGVWATCALYIVVLGTLLHRRFRSGAWRGVQVFAA